MRKLAVLVFLIIVVVLFFSIAPFTLMDLLDKLTGDIGQQETIKPKLEVSVRENSSYWQTGGAGGFPELVSDVAYSVSNLGSGPAENVEVTAEIDGERVSTSSVELLRPSGTYSNSITVSTRYKSAKIVKVDASCSFSSATKAFIVNANLTRNPDKNSSRSFITPEGKSVVELKNAVLKSKPLSTPNWIALRDWVGTSIQYRGDPEIHGENEYWQFPNETIALGTGDCEDFSILLCSLLRADGWSPDKVYVIAGEKNNQYHAWVRVTWNDLQYNIEPGANGFATALGDALSLSGFDAKYYFNDEKLGTFD